MFSCRQIPVFWHCLDPPAPEKSLTLNAIAGLLKPDSGMIAINGDVLFDSDRDVNLASKDRRIGYVFQNYALFPHLTVYENVAFGLKKGFFDRKLKGGGESGALSENIRPEGNCNRLFPEIFPVARPSGWHWQGR